MYNERFKAEEYRKEPETHVWFDLSCASETVRFAAKTCAGGHACERRCGCMQARRSARLNTYESACASLPLVGSTLASVQGRVCVRAAAHACTLYTCMRASANIRAGRARAMWC
eukprot:3670514-Pleurochrysis_carterae.AAC.3